jgi:hypothetical protein
MLACEEHDIKQQNAPQVQAFPHFGGSPTRDHEPAQRTSNPRYPAYICSIGAGSPSGIMAAGHNPTNAVYPQGHLPVPFMDLIRRP